MFYKPSIYCLVLAYCLLAPGCGEEATGPVTATPTPSVPPPTGDTTSLDDGAVDFGLFSDTYSQLASADQTDNWMHYNVHDPVYLVEEDFTWCYNTDVAYGHAIRPGIQIRRSINLVEWEFVGWALPGIPVQGANFIRRSGGEPFGNIWAPYVIEVGGEYRLYYSLSSPTPRLSAIGLATADKPRGPFRERELVVTSRDDASRQTNAIDPTVIVTPTGEHWMYYGSAWDGIYKLELDPDTGLAMRNGDKGVRVAQRGFTGNTINGNLEGPEIIYHPGFDQYYLFLAYDWLETKYNVRVGRSDSPTGPFYDYLGNDLNDERDDLPMILAPYRFLGHSGWQGVSHPGVFEKNDNFYLGHQGRPGVDPLYMVMHLRQLFWTEGGWPIVSSQRYATEEESAVGEAEISGGWELILFDYTVVPGYADEQRSPGFSDAQRVDLSDDGSVSGATTGTWSYDSPWLTLALGGSTYTLRTERGRDWENEVAETILLTGLDAGGNAAWAKKVSN
ncbi:arabinan endo-1,5-alpha-L-arabinosidase [Neolewinella sp.]|uniref:arabinan endo-1,5-alpha-L-arabinosidase n=1 Tax=Neolewinella sp. TaxID=2993543 RepID=UPI003B516E49